MSIDDIVFSSRGNEVTLKSKEYANIVISAADFKRLKIDTDLLPVHISDGNDEKILFWAEKLKAVKYSAFLLSYGDKSSKKLREKLRLKGFSEDISEAAIDLLCRQGYIDDSSLCEKTLLRLANDKLYGPFKVKEMLKVKGFSSDDITNAFENTDIDFYQNAKLCFGKIVSKYDLYDDSSRKKLSEKMIRYGYSYDMVKECFEELL